MKSKKNQNQILINNDSKNDGNDNDWYYYFFYLNCRNDCLQMINEMLLLVKLQCIYCNVFGLMFRPFNSCSQWQCITY